MKNTPSALKWMAEKRARLAHDLAQTQRIAVDVNKRAETLQLDLDAMDRALVMFDSAIEPTQIEPVQAHRRYGPRGALRATILDVIRTHAPEWVASENVEILVCLKLGLTFETPALRKRWYNNSLKKQMKLFVEEGLVERLHSPDGFTSEEGHWRVKREQTTTLTELRAKV